MAGKDFSIQAKILLDAAGFTTGKDKVSKDAKALEKGIKESNNVIKDSFSTLTNAALPQFGQQFGELGGVFGGVKSAISTLIPAFKGIKAALIASGVGTVIILITTAIAGLIGWMKRTDEGGDTMRKVFDIIKAVIEVVLNKITSLGSAIVKVFKGDFRGALTDAKEGLTGWGQAIKENIAIAKQLNETQDKLEDYNETYALKRAQIEERISELQAKARDEESYSAQERLAFTNKLKQANLELYNLNKGQKQLEINALKQEIAMGADNQENRQKINDKEAELVGLRTTYNQGLKETIKLTNKLSDDAALEAQKEADKKSGVTTKIDTTGKQASANKLFDINSINKLSTVQPVSTAVLSSWDSLKEKIKGSADAMKLMETSISAFGDTMTSMIAGQKDAFKNYVGEILNSIRKVLMAKLAEAIMSMFAGESTKGVAGLAIAAGGATVLTGLYQRWAGSFANGGITPYSGYALVGEKGPEIARFPAGTRIYNNNQTMQMLGGGNQEIKLRIEGTDLVGVLNNYNNKYNRMM